MFNLKMKSYCKRQRCALADIPHYRPCSLPPKTQRWVPSPTSLSPESYWTVPQLLPEQRNSLISCLLTIPSSVSMERAIISWCCLFFQVMQGSINSISAIFHSCFNILQIETCLQVIYRIVSTILRQFKEVGLISTLFLQPHPPSFPIFLPCIYRILHYFQNDFMPVLLFFFPEESLLFYKK